MTMLQIYLYQYWTVAETQKKGRSAPRPCVDLIIIIIKCLKTSDLIKNNDLHSYAKLLSYSLHDNSTIHITVLVSRNQH